MNFRIRYRQSEGSREDEVVVEANTPTEALVKFRCIREARPYGSSRDHLITSVAPADRSDSVRW